MIALSSVLVSASGTAPSGYASRPARLWRSRTGAGGGHKENDLGNFVRIAVTLHSCQDSNERCIDRAWREHLTPYSAARMIDGGCTCES